MSYRVRLNVFEGPFDLLVYLIEHAQMSIYDIRISEITDQYVQYIRQMQEADINVSTEFMVLAAELLEIKSKMLLPRRAVCTLTRQTISAGSICRVPDFCGISTQRRSRAAS